MDSNLSKELEKLKKVEEEGKTRLDRIRELEEELRKVSYCFFFKILFCETRGKWREL